MNLKYFAAMLLLVSAFNGILNAENKKKETIMQEKNFSEIDKNFKQKKTVDSTLRYINAYQKPIVLEGQPFKNPDGRRSRLPLATAELMRKKPLAPVMQTAGAVIRFRTNSPVIGMRLKLSEYYTGLNRRLSAGFDLYAGSGTNLRFIAAHVMEKPCTDYEFSWRTSRSMTEYSIYLPTFCSFYSIEIGFKPGSSVEAPAPRAIKKAIAFYGSSLTNCGAASRPGLLYPAIIGRMMDVETINIGFGGGCFGEKCVADQIAKLNLSAFVLEYDHNAPDPEFLRKTHEPFFKHLRKLCPKLPILMFSMPAANFHNEKVRIRRAIIARTWLNAFESGDLLVEFIDGETFFEGGTHREDCTDDTCHQNDLGERIMAEQITSRLQRMLSK